MEERIAKRDFLFIDETGDPGYDFSHGSSTYFAFGCVHLTDLSLEQLQRHLFAMGYFSNQIREWKSSRLSRVQKEHFEDIAKWICSSADAAISVVLVDKTRYVGPYFRHLGERPYNAFFFRNFLIRQLLELHFQYQKLVSSECELVFDRSSNEACEGNLRVYLRGNFHLPTFTNIVHCDSRYVPALQFTDVMVHLAKEYMFGLRGHVDERLLRCIRVFDVSDPRHPAPICVDTLWT